MRCGCVLCGAYMVHKDKGKEGCVCPRCGNECKICLGGRIPSPAIERTPEGKLKIPEEIRRRFGKDEE